MARFKFDTNAAIAFAWDKLWANNLKQRERETHSRWAARTYYLTAADIENQVRELAAATARGESWEQAPLAWGRPYTGIRFPGNLQGQVRDWLFRNRNLTYHNFGRGHISGARFRPVGEPVSPTEQETFKRKAVERTRVAPVHYAESYFGAIKCIKKRSGFSNYRSNARRTKKHDEVTCPRCLKLLTAQTAGVENADSQV